VPEAGTGHSGFAGRYAQDLEGQFEMILAVSGQNPPAEPFLRPLQKSQRSRPVAPAPRRGQGLAWFWGFDVLPMLLNRNGGKAPVCHYSVHTLYVHLLVRLV
jgi:hypothetical protein